MSKIGDFEFSDELQLYLAEQGHTRESIERYVARVPVDIEGMLPWIPGELKAFWDIGCGIGGHAALLHFLSPQNPYIFVSEGDGSNPRKVGFMPDTKGWYDIVESLKFITANTVAADVGIADNAPMDLIYSLKSWGHHYPIETYLPDVMRRLNVGGRLIIDIRTGTCGAEILEAHGFRMIGEILAKPKRRRLVFER